jgi:hypothetical protein
MNKLLFLVTSFALLAAVAGACGGGGKKSVTVGDTKYTAGGSLPDSFPKDFPVYGGADFKGSVTTSQQGQSGAAATWETGDSLDKVKAYYSEQLGGKSNWVQDSATDTGAGSFYSFHRNGGDGKEGFLTLTSSDGKTAFIVFIGESRSAGNATSAPATANSSSSPAAATADSGAATLAPSGADLPPEVALSKDFPKDRVPFPSGARVTSTNSLSAGGTNTFFVEIYVKDFPESVEGYFKDELPKRGWTNSLTSNANGAYFASFSGSDTEVVTLTIEQSDTLGYAKVGLSVVIGG